MSRKTGTAHAAAEPIAIVGRGCILPGSASPGELWRTVAGGHCELTAAPEGGWRVDMDRVVRGEPGQPVPDCAWSSQGGYIRDFETIFDPGLSRLDADLVRRLDPDVQWSLYASRQALAETVNGPDGHARGGLIMGNLSYPTRCQNRFAERAWLRRSPGRASPDQADVDPLNRFMSGLPAMLVARGCGLEGGALALDAACASSLYAIKIACDRLRDGRADLMLAGGVNAADPLFVHIGFAALNATSRSGRSRPFHRDADGLVPAEGAAFVALKRLADAEAEGDTIHGVIRGVGLSNDGRSGGLLSPDPGGQVRAMRAALDTAHISPEAVQFVECHATGTAVGDPVEIASLRAVYGSAPLVLGSLKANLGHLITAAGAAGLIKTLSAMEHGEIPATHGSHPLADAVKSSPYSVPEQAQAWPEHAGQRTAAVSAFGFGGNNAHLLVQQHAPARRKRKSRRQAGPSGTPGELAVVGIGLRTQHDPDHAAFVRRHIGGAETPAGIDRLSLPVRRRAFPPKELERALGQQLAMLDVVEQATVHLPPLDAERTGVYVGMQTDCTTARYCLRLRMPDLLAQTGISAGPELEQAAMDAVIEPLGAYDVLGKMPNIVANRLNAMLDLHGPGFTVSREELSGDAALDLAHTALQNGEIDTALVAAVDLCREPVHEEAARAVLGEAGPAAADVAVMLVVKTRARAEQDGDAVFALISPDAAPAGAALGNTDGDSPLGSAVGHAHAASGLLHIALAADLVRVRARHDDDGVLQPWLGPQDTRAVTVTNRSFAGESAAWRVREAPPAALPPGARPRTGPALRCYAASDPDALAQRLRRDAPGGEGECRIALVATPDEQAPLRERALEALRENSAAEAWTLDGIEYRRRTLAGELAFVFTGMASAYPGMGRGFVIDWPELVDAFADRARDMTPYDWIYAGPEDPRAGLPYYQFAGMSFLCQVHAAWSRGVLGLKPAAAIGLSAGETNALFAFDVWQDMDAMMRELAQSDLNRHTLAGDFGAVRRHWGLPGDAAIDWVNLRVRADVDRVREAVAGVDRVYLTIVTSPVDCMIGGDRARGEQVLRALGRPPVIPLGQDLVIHCEVVSDVVDSWRALHSRTTTPHPEVRFYANHLGGVVELDEASLADALAGQALQTVDFPRTVEQAWKDGVRIFVEHGPADALSGAIGEILGEREHLAVALDRPQTPGSAQACAAAARLWCAGVDLDVTALAETTSTTVATDTGSGESAIEFDLHLAPIELPDLPGIPSAPDVYVPPRLPVATTDAVAMPAAPPLARLVPGDTTVVAPAAVTDASGGGPEPAVNDAAPGEPVRPARDPAMPAPDAAVAASPSVPQGAGANADRVHRCLETHRLIVDSHRHYTAAQHEALHAYMAMVERVRHTTMGGPPPAVAAHGGSAAPAATAAIADTRPTSGTVRPNASVGGGNGPATAEAPGAATSASRGTVAGGEQARASSHAAPRDDGTRGQERSALPGPKFDRRQLETLAGGRISSVFGPEFADQDDYRLQVRMPEPPLLLCDRVLGIEGEPHSMGLGAIWTETDVHPDSWYLHHGRMPAGVFIESGQADLLLISWLGIDRLNRGERAYRLLGCELTYHGDLPAPGDTIEHEIRIDGHARYDDVRLFFFRYDGMIDGERRISVRNGQAGFFTADELANSDGVIWDPATADYTANGRVAPPPAPTDKTSFGIDEVEAYLAGDLVACFGEAFAWTCTHTRTPRTPAGARSFLGPVTELDFNGGPAGRGYMRIEHTIDPAAWYFDGHFKNDPCMPGTLMAEAAMQAMAFYMVASGHTLRRDGWRFRPPAEHPHRFYCRGQVTPESRHIVYELFVDEYIDGDRPVLHAHMLCTVDGRKAFLCERAGQELVPDWPLSSMPEWLNNGDDERPVAKIGDFPLDYRALINLAWGRPVDGLGPAMCPPDEMMRVPRLPGPPLHFVTRIIDLQGELGSMAGGGHITALYDIPPDAWYLADDPAGTVPHAVMMEIALQPCGLLAYYTLAPDVADRDLVFRNLEGDAVQHRRLGAGDGTVRTEVELTSLKRAGDVIIARSHVRCLVGEETVFEVATAFGFFPPQAMDLQKGFDTSAEDRRRLAAESDVHIETASGHAALFNDSRARLPRGRLAMIDRITGFWPEGGTAGLGLIRAEKDVDPRDWFFKVHFFQDPVQPGSLGVEAMLQLIQAHMLLQGLGDDIDDPSFEPTTIGDRAEWHYRGQITPDLDRIVIEFDAREQGRGERGAYLIGMARLWVGDLQIYQAPRIGVRMVPDDRRDRSA